MAGPNSLRMVEVVRMAKADSRLLLLNPNALLSPTIRCSSAAVKQMLDRSVAVQNGGALHLLVSLGLRLPGRVFPGKSSWEAEPRRG